MKKIFFINLYLYTLYLSYFSIYCGFCGLNPPLDKSYCGNYLSLNKTHRCCYCKEESTGNYYCLVKKIHENISGYYCDEEVCNTILVNQNLPGAPCLNHRKIKQKQIDDPDSISEEYCHSHSIDETHPCCYYDDGVNKKCFSIGEISSQTLYTYNDFLKCSTNYYKINFIIFIFLLIFII